jgi:hypothetical protein
MWAMMAKLGGLVLNLGGKRGWDLVDYSMRKASKSLLDYLAFGVFVESLKASQLHGSRVAKQPLSTRTAQVQMRLFSLTDKNHAALLLLIRLLQNQLRM